MGNTTSSTTSDRVPIDDQAGEEENAQEIRTPRTQTGARSNVIYHVLLNRGSDASEIRREEVNLESLQPATDTMEEGDDDSDSGEYAEEQDDQLLALQIISQLLGVRPNLRRRYLLTINTLL